MVYPINVIKYDYFVMLKNFTVWILAGTPRAGSLLAPISISVDNTKMNIKDIENGGKRHPNVLSPPVSIQPRKLVS